jgi:hypothetical protein
MKKKLLLTLLILGMPLILSAQKTRGIESKPGNQVLLAKRVSFNASKRNPFLSKEEVFKIEEMRKAEIRRLELKRLEEIRKAEEERKRLLQQQILEEELRRHPSREVSDKIKIDGIMGRDAIVNGQVLSIGNKILGAKVVAVTDDAVWFVYKGERFQVKLPLL